MACECAFRMDEALKDRGVSINFNLLPPHQTMIEVDWDVGYKRKRGERLPKLVATFCPFCGQRYEAA